MKKYLLSGIALSFAAALSASTALADITIGMAGPITGQRLDPCKQLRGFFMWGHGYRKNVTGFYKNPLGRSFLEDTDKTQ